MKKMRQVKNTYVVQRRFDGRTDKALINRLSFNTPQRSWVVGYRINEKPDDTQEPCVWGSLEEAASDAAKDGAEFLNLLGKPQV